MKEKVIYSVFILFTLIILGTFFVSKKHTLLANSEGILDSFFNDREELERELAETQELLRLTKLKKSHIHPPEEGVKALYMTSYVAGNKSFRDRVVNIIESTEANSLIIDIKEVDGYISFNIGDKEIFPYQRNLMPDIEQFIKELHEKNIYVIGRIVLFKDKVWAQNNPEYSVLKKSDTSQVWSDYGGKKFIDPGAKPFWDYLYKISAESYKIGFDELNFDYIRYPSDGKMSDTYYPYSNKVISELGGEEGRVTVLSGFMQEITQKLRSEFPEIKLSADVFGMVATNNDDLTIGQKLEPFLANFDYVSPMVYPSHYPSGFIGITYPDLFPYEIVYHSQKRAQDRLERLISLETKMYDALSGAELLEDEVLKQQSLEAAESFKEELLKRTYLNNTDNVNLGVLRPWIQDFTCTWCTNYIYYGQEEIQKQIKATEDAGQKGWMVWNPANKYILSDFIK